MHVSNMSCRAFAQTLAARVSNPGGGSAAALAGALGCALAAMSAGFTCGKPAYTPVSYTHLTLPTTPYV